MLLKTPKRLKNATKLARILGVGYIPKGRRKTHENIRHCFTSFLVQHHPGRLVDPAAEDPIRYPDLDDLGLLRHFGCAFVDRNIALKAQDSMKRTSAKVRPISNKDKAVLSNLGVESLSLYYDWPRRMQNALRVLSSDPHLIIWLEKEFPKRIDGNIEEITRLLEIRVRIRILKIYGWLGRNRPGDIIFNDRMLVNDDGNLQEV
jgi:hypothetical protein